MVKHCNLSEVRLCLFFIDWETIFILWENLALLHHDILSSSILLRRGKEEGESKSLAIERRIKNKFLEYPFRGNSVRDVFV